MFTLSTLLWDCASLSKSLLALLAVSLAENPSFPSLSSHPQKCLCPLDGLRCPSFDPFPHSYFSWTHRIQIATKKHVCPASGYQRCANICCFISEAYCRQESTLDLGLFRAIIAVGSPAAEEPASYGSSFAPEPHCSSAPFCPQIWPHL